MLKTCVALLLCLLAFAVFLAAQQPAPVCESIPNDGSLMALTAGNLRYAGDEPRVPPRPRHVNQSVSCAKERAGSQKPFAVVLSCSDSRVPPEVVFDLGIGDLFVVREAGNVATPGVLGSIEYAVSPAHFGTKLVVVMGHKRCGAVEAAFCPKPPEYIRTLWNLIRPAVPVAWRRRECDHPVIDPAQWDRAVRNNVENMAKAVEADLRRVRQPGVTVVRAYYDLDNGKVELPMK